LFNLRLINSADLVDLSRKKQKSISPAVIITNSSFKDFWVLVNTADLYSKIEVPSIGSKLNSAPSYFSIIPLVFWAL
jgi:hypothetical protein